METIDFTDDVVPPLLPDSIPDATSSFGDIGTLYELLTDTVLMSPDDGVANDVGLCLECHDDEVIHLVDEEDLSINTQSSPAKNNSLPQAVEIPRGQSSTYRLTFPKKLEDDHSRISCNECTKTFTRGTLLLDHKAVSHNAKDQYWCKHCRYKGQTYRNWHKHVKRKHPNEDPKTDHLFSKETSDCDTLPNDANAGTDVGHKKTKIAKSVEKRDLKITAQSPKGTCEMVKCEECSKSFLKKKSLRDHKRTHVKDSAHKCIVPECGKLFKTSSALNEHKVTVHATKVHKCTHDGCTKAYAIKRDLLYHKRVHGDRFACTFSGCRKRFRDAYNLEVHLKSHKGHKDKECDLCDYVCVQKSSLNWHRKTKHHGSLNNEIK